MIQVIDNFDLQQIADSGQCFRWEKIEDNIWRIPAKNKILVISQHKNQFELSCTEKEFREYWEEYFDLKTDYKKMMESGKKYQDVFLNQAIKHGAGMRILQQDFWEVLISFLISQNNNIKRITKIIQNLCQEDIFPSPEMLFEMNLTDKGLGYRDIYIKDAAKWKISEEGRSFTDIKGVGPKVEACIRLYGLHELQYCPMDTWMKRIVLEEYNGKKPKWMDSQYAGYFQQVCFYYKRMVL